MNILVDFNDVLQKYLYIFSINFILNSNISYFDLLCELRVNKF